MRSNCNVGLLPLTAFTVEVCGSSPYAYFGLGNASEPRSSRVRVGLEVRGTVSVVRFGMRNRVVRERGKFRLRGHTLLRGVSCRGNAVGLRKGRCGLLSAGFPAVSPGGPCGLASRRSRVVSHLIRTFIKYRGLRRRVHFLLTGNNLCGMCGGGLLCRKYMPLSTGKGLGRMRVFKGGCHKGTLCSILRDCIEGKFFTLSPGRQRSKGSAV